MSRTVRAMRSTVRNAFLEAWSNRAGFWSQVSIMVLNDVAWVAFWVIFFHEVGDLNGWDTSRVLMLQAILTTGGGVVLGLFNNARRVGELAADGGLDSLLALPVPTLPVLLVRRFEPVNLGDVLFGTVLFATTGHPTPSRVAIYLFGSAAAAVILTGFLVAVGSLAFFVGRNEGSELGFHAIIMFASYPIDVFSGPGRALLYSLVPAAFVASVPATMIGSFDLATAAALLGIAALFATIGTTMFHLGLRRYTSGSTWTRA